MKKIIYILTIFIIVFTFLCFNSYDKVNKIDYVPDEDTAVKIAEVIFLSMYGKEILEYKPYKTQLINKEYWRVEGYLDEEEAGIVPIIEIRKIRLQNT